MGWLEEGNVLEKPFRLSKEVSEAAWDRRSKWRGCCVKWRRLRSIPQHIYLLDATLAENVAFGVAMERIDRARVQEVLKSAQLGDVMARLPEGIDQSIGENGVQLSGGERQRVGRGAGERKKNDQQIARIEGRS